MKKLVMTFAIVAFLIGGLSLNASAQKKVKATKSKVEITQDEKKLGKAQDEKKLGKAQDEKKIGKAQDEKKIGNAQGEKKIGNAQGEKKIGNAQGVANYDQMLKDFETNIDMYIVAYEKAMKGTADKNDFMTYQKKALALQAMLDKAKDKLNPNQVEQYIKLKAKLAEALRRK